jgi:chromosome segregation ATPase
MPRRDDDLFDTMSIVPDSDGRTPRPEAQKSAPARASRNSTASSGTGANTNTVIFGTVALLLAGVCGYFHYQNTLQQELNAKLQQRLETLESQLGMTTSTATQTSQSLGQKVVDLDVRIKSADTEIRKLWAINNDKNKKILDGHDSRLGDHDKALSSLQTNISELKKSVALTEKSLGDVTRTANTSEQAVTDATRTISEMRSAVGTLQQRISQGDPLLREASQQAAMAQEQTEQLQSKVDSLSKRVSDHDETLKSVDTFRRSVNNDIGKLKQQSIGAPPLQQP